MPGVRDSYGKREATGRARGRAARRCRRARRAGRPARGPPRGALLPDRERAGEFERKKQAADVPGAQAESHEGSDADPRPGTSESAGAADDGGQATGNPPNDDSPAADDEGQATGNPPNDDSPAADED